MHATALSGFISASGYLRMNDEFQNALLERLQAIESRVARLADDLPDFTRLLIVAMDVRDISGAIVRPSEAAFPRRIDPISP
jgi:hypothetical protein